MLPLFTEPNKILSRFYAGNIPLQKYFHIAKKFVEQFIKIPVWTFHDESDIVDRYIASFKKVCDYILENKGF